MLRDVDAQGLTVTLSDVSDRAWGFAANGHVSIHPDSVGLPVDAFCYLLGHELCHAMQQRLGWEAGCRIATTDELEAEADMWGRRWAAGDGAFAVPVPLLRADPEARLNAVQVGGRLLGSTADMSPQLQGVISLIKGGNQWIRWAIGSEDMNIGFPDDSSCALGVLEGLHGTGLMLLSATELLVSPRRLLELDSVTLDRLLDAEESGSVRGLAGILNAGELLNADDLASVGSSLESYGIAGNPLFQAMGLADRIALYHAFQGEGAATSEASGEAVDFAVGLASTPSGFAEIYRFYRTVAGADAGKAPVLAGVLWEFYRGMILEKLLAPEVGFPVSSSQAATLPARLIESGFGLGFPSVASGARQIAAYTAALGELEQPGCSTVDRYISAAEGFLVDAELASSVLSQDGSTQLLRYSGKNDQTAALLVDQSGCLTLGAYSDPSAEAGFRAAASGTDSANGSAPQTGKDSAGKKPGTATK